MTRPARLIAVTAVVAAAGSLLTGCGQGTPSRPEAKQGRVVTAVSGRGLHDAAAGRDGILYVYVKDEDREEVGAVAVSRPGHKLRTLLRAGDDFPGGKLGTVRDLAVDPRSGALLILDGTGNDPRDQTTLRMVDPGGQRRSMSLTGVETPYELAAGPGGEILVVGRCQIARVSFPDGLTIIAGRPCADHPQDEETRNHSHPVAGALVTEAPLHPHRVALDEAGTLYFSDGAYGDALYRVGTDGRIAELLPDCQACNFGDLGWDATSRGLYLEVRQSADEEWVLWLGNDGSRAVVAGQAPNGGLRPTLAPTAEDAAAPTQLSAVGSDGRLFLSDHRGRIEEIVRPDLHPRRPEPRPGAPTTVLAALLGNAKASVTDLASTPDGTLYLALRGSYDEPQVLVVPPTGDPRPLLRPGDAFPDGPGFSPQIKGRDRDRSPDVAVDPRRGTVYVSDLTETEAVVRVLRPDGSRATLTVPNTGPDESSGLKVADIVDMAVDPTSGDLYVTNGCRVARLSAEKGTGAVVAGTPGVACIFATPQAPALGPQTRADGQKALWANLSVTGLAVGSGGRLFMAESGQVRSLRPDGTLETVVEAPCDRRTCEALGLAVAPAGGDDLYFGDIYGARLWRARPGKPPEVVAATSPRGSRRRPAAALPEKLSEVFRVAVDAAGIVYAAGDERPSEDGGRSQPSRPLVVAVRP